MVVPWLHKPSSLVVPASPWPSCPTSVGLCSFSTTSLCHGVQNSDSKCCPTTTTLSGNSKKLVPHDSHQVWNTSEVRKTLYFHLCVHCCSGASTEHLTFYLQGHLLPRLATSLSYTSQLSTAPGNLFFFSLGTLASCYLGWLCNEYFVKYIEDQTPMLRTYLVLDVLISHFATLHFFPAGSQPQSQYNSAGTYLQGLQQKAHNRSRFLKTASSCSIKNTSNAQTLLFTSGIDFPVQ